MYRIFLVFALLISLQARAELSGWDIMTNICEKEGVEFEFACSTYVGGAVEMSAFYQDIVLKQNAYCTSEGFNHGIAEKVWRKYLEDNPEHLQLPAAATIHFSLMTAYPCDD